MSMTAASAAVSGVLWSLQTVLAGILDLLAVRVAVARQGVPLPLAEQLVEASLASLQASLTEATRIALALERQALTSEEQKIQTSEDLLVQLLAAKPALQPAEAQEEFG